MVLKIGYDNTQSENKFYIRYTTMLYAEYLSRLLKEPRRINRPLEVELSKINSAFGLKYQMIIKNFFFFKLDKQIFSLESTISQRYKMNKLVNFEISPYVKLSLVNNKIPLIVSLKQYIISPSRKQILEGNDFSDVIPSLFPYKVKSMSVEHLQSKEFPLFTDNNLLLYKLKASYGSIENLENFLKLSATFKFLLDLPIPGVDAFSLALHSENSIKKSFIRKTSPLHNKDDKHSFQRNHVISNYECYSKLLGVNILSEEGYVDNGVDFYIHSNNALRIKDIKYFRDTELLNRIEPYFGFEGVYRPVAIKQKNTINEGNTLFKDKFTLLCSLGFSIKIQDYLYVDFMIKSWSYNSVIDHNKVNRFRIGLEMSTNI